jgi:hypothetical protein
MSRRRFLIFLPLLLAASPAPSAVTQFVSADETAGAARGTFDVNVRREVVAKLSDALRNNYVFPDVGQKAADKIAASLAAGEYDSLSDANAFAARLSGDVAAIAHDKHLWIAFIDAPPQSMPAPSGAKLRSEAGVTRADRLAGGVGYIEVIGFPPLPMFKPALDRAMSALKGSRALIIDDRRNGGGAPDGVAYLVSYLVSPNRFNEISDIVSRVPKTSEFKRQRFRSQSTPVSFAHVPVYVLTSKNTFSGGEAFAYDVQALKRGKIVGEVTGGGANPTGPVELGHGFVGMIPFARAENPITKTNWEGRGVQPDVTVPADRALKVALQMLGRKPASEIASASIQQVFIPRSTPRPGSESAARQLVAGLLSGKPDYTVMTSDYADLIRTQLPQLQRLLLPLGELRAMKFRQVGMMGGDQYEISFTKGAIIIAVLLDSSGKLFGAQIMPPAAGQ